MLCFTTICLNSFYAAIGVIIIFSQSHLNIIYVIYFEQVCLWWSYETYLTRIQLHSKSLSSKMPNISKQSEYLVSTYLKQRNPLSDIEGAKSGAMI